MSEERSVQAPATQAIATQLSALTRPSWSDLFEVMLSALPTIGGPLETYLSQRQQRAAFERISEVLQGVDSRIVVLERQGQSARLDEEFVELLVNVAPLAARTRSEEKRRSFAALLANASVRIDATSREAAKTMALLLDALEFAHIELLNRLMALPFTQSYDGLWGAHRRISVDRTFFARTDGDLLLRLSAVGLVDLTDFRNSKDRSKGAGSLVVDSLGVAFHAWLTEPDASEGVAKPFAKR